MVGRDVLGAPRPRDAAEDAHGHAGRRGRRPLPRTAPHHAEHMVGRDVLGAPRPRDAAEDAHGHAGRRGRRPLPRTAPHHAEHMVGRDVLGAPRPRDAAEDAHGHAGRRGRRPLPRTAPHHAEHMVGRDVLGAPRPRRRRRGRTRRAAPTKTPPRQSLNHSFGGTRLSRPYPVGRDKRDPPYATSATLPTGRTGPYRLE